MRCGSFFCLCLLFLPVLFVRFSLFLLLIFVFVVSLFFGSFVVFSGGLVVGSFVGFFVGSFVGSVVVLSLVLSLVLLLFFRWFCRCSVVVLSLVLSLVLLLFFRLSFFCRFVCCWFVSVSVRSEFSMRSCCGFPSVVVFCGRLSFVVCDQNALCIFASDFNGS